MYNLRYTHQFNKDVKKAKKRNKDFNKFKVIARMLVSGQTLESKYKDHVLIGNYVGRRECHIESDWLLIYKIEGQELIFERMGTHSDLFKK